MTRRFTEGGTLRGMARSERTLGDIRTGRFDVICAGQPLWRGSTGSLEDVARGSGSVLVAVTRVLARAGLRVAWAGVVEDDRRGRAVLDELTALRVDVGAVRLTSGGAGLVTIDSTGGWSGPVAERGAATAVEIPEGWSSPVLLLSGLKPVTAALAGFCRSARSARRRGAVVLLDLVGSLRDWAGHDPRVISMVLREADVVRCSFFDLAVIGVDARAVRRSMKPDATLVLDDDGAAVALGTFGEVGANRDCSARLPPVAYTAAICADHARPRGLGESTASRWHRILAHEAPRLERAHRHVQ